MNEIDVKTNFGQDCKLKIVKKKLFTIEIIDLK